MPRTFLPVVVATATATYVGRSAFGLNPAFIVPEAAVLQTSDIHALELLAFVVLGALAGVTSYAFIRLLAFCEDLFPKLPGNLYTQNIVGMTAVGLIGYVFVLLNGHADTMGVGYATIQAILEGRITLVWLLTALFVAKTLATTISLGSGASGGVFSPSLFIGATPRRRCRSAGTMAFPKLAFLARRVRRCRDGCFGRRSDRRLDDRDHDDFRDDARLQRDCPAGLDRRHRPSVCAAG